MLKFLTMKDGKPLIGLGITEDNIRKLKEGMPIYISAADMLKDFNLDEGIMVFYGKTDQKLADILKPFMRSDTTVTGRPNI